MTGEEAKQFLRSHQPLPQDDMLSADLIRTLDEVRKYLLSYPDTQCIPLLLGVFGAGSGYGVYQRIEDVLLKFEPKLVVPHLRRGLQSAHEGVRFWNAQFASSFPSASLVEPLAQLLTQGDFDLKYAALTALEQIKSPRARAVAREFLRGESETELRAIAKQIAKE